jgi:tellurite resistance protein TerC
VTPVAFVFMRMLSPALLATPSICPQIPAAAIMFIDFINQLREAAPVIVSLIIIEGLLSVDNMLAIAALASQLPEDQKKKALRLGLAGAYVFRIVALFFAGFIMAHEWVKFLGAFYLIHLMAGHLHAHATQIAAGDGDKAAKPHTFWSTILAIQLMDLSLSVDNVVAAVAMSPDIRVVCLGVCLGLLTLWMFASVSLKLVDRFPILQHTAFLLIGYVGCILLVEMIAGHFFGVKLHISAFQKFIGIVIIMGLSVCYDKSVAFQRFCAPIFKIAAIPIAIYSTVGNFLIGLITWPFRALLAIRQGRNSAN